MQQLEIEFFWPLTEQIPLELDYSECIPPKPESEATFNPYVISAGSGITYAPVSYSTVLSIDKNFYVSYNEEPPWYRKIILQLLGLKWRQ